MKKIALLFMVVVAIFVFAACDETVQVVTNNSGEIVVNPNVSGEEIPGEGIDLKALIEEKISKMTLEDKIEQMLILDYSLVTYGQEDEKDATKLSSITKEIIENHNIGGIILFRDNTKGTEQTLRLVNDFQ